MLGIVLTYTGSSVTLIAKVFHTQKPLAMDLKVRFSSMNTFGITQNELNSSISVHYCSIEMIRIRYLKEMDFFNRSDLGVILELRIGRGGVGLTTQRLCSSRQKPQNLWQKDTQNYADCSCIISKSTHFFPHFSRYVQLWNLYCYVCYVALRLNKILRVIKSSYLCQC